MIKKITIISISFFIGIAFSTIASMNFNSNSSGSNGNVGWDSTINSTEEVDSLMGEFDNIMKEVKTICTMDAKECPDGSYVGRVGPKCEFEKCPIVEEKKDIPQENKKEVRIKEYNTGITGGITGINNKVINPKKEGGENWVQIDNQFSFNLKTKEWKDDKGICHTCTEENGFTKNGKIMINGEVDSSVKQDKDEKDFMTKENIINFGVQRKKGSNDIFIVFENGKKIKIEEIKLEGDHNEIENLEIRINPLKAEKIAKKNTSTEIIVESKIVGNGDSANYIIKTQKTGKLLGLFDFDLNTEVKIDVETGVVVEVDEPWYSFLIF